MIIWKVDFSMRLKSYQSYDLPNWAAKKVDVLKSDIKWVKEYLERGEILKAKKMFRKNTA
ncbi:MAG: hypothetical protein WDO19_20180 [Bacteroidota bacterium]